MTIAIQEISHSFNQLKVLDSITLSLEPDLTHILVGPSGCGKTTLLQIIAGIIQPDSGQVLLPDSSNRTALIFQTPTLIPWLTVKSNIQLVTKSLPLSPEAAQTRVEQVLTQVGLQQFGGCFPRQLSGGMQQRAAFARAIVTQPDLLLMDEPFSGLDAISRRLLGEELLLDQASSRLQLMVTHNLEEAVLLGDRIHVLSPRPGRIIKSVPNPIVAADRLSENAQPKLFSLQQELWHTLRQAMNESVAL
ncbi:ABC transporter ATP-binding protein [Endozoicomonadaceae bacterium StTr2]